MRALEKRRAKPSPVAVVRRSIGQSVGPASFHSANLARIRQVAATAACRSAAAVLQLRPMPIPLSKQEQQMCVPSLFVTYYSGLRVIVDLCSLAGRPGLVFLHCKINLPKPRSPSLRQRTTNTSHDVRHAPNTSSRQCNATGVLLRRWRPAARSNESYFPIQNSSLLLMSPQRTTRARAHTHTHTAGRQLTSSRKIPPT